jgi:hypothetical protein
MENSAMSSSGMDWYAWPNFSNKVGERAGVEGLFIRNGYDGSILNFE